MDWDLEAVVKGCSSIEAAPTTTMEDPFLNFSFHNNFFSSEDDMFFSFPEFSESTRVLDELEELYKPFYPVLHTSTLISPQTMVTIPQPAAITPKEPEEDVKVKPSHKVVAPQDLQQLPSASKSKRSKKNLNKRVVKQVTAAEIGVCDAWAWRKYGQKPIKGSPYPRSYYRCSSSKGCLARKQVERNHLDPGVFLVSYTAEHNHPHPTRRNSLAGSTRKNNSLVASTITSTTCDDDKNKTNNTCSSSSNSSSAVMSLSPRTPLVVQSMEDEIVTSVEEQSGINNNNKAGSKEEEDFVELLDNDEGAEFGDDDDWFSNTQNIDHEMMGLDYRQLEMEMEIEIDGCDFMDGFAAAT